jgi:DNA-binding winged helix-turn-helix (wHTH) protein
MPSATYRFGAFELDENLYQLRRDGEPIRLEPKVFDMLLALVRNRDRVVSKDELLDLLWPGAAISESVLPTNVAAVRRILRTDPASRDAIKTVHGRGYHFVGTVTEASDATADHAPPQASSSDQPSTHPSGPTQSSRPRPPSPPVRRRPFVGRESEMESLTAALQATLGGHGRLELLMGEPGIGKTRTLDELGEEAQRHGTLVLTGRCYEGEGAPAFWPWVQVLRSALKQIDDMHTMLGADAADLATLLPELAPSHASASQALSPSTHSSQAPPPLPSLLNRPNLPPHPPAPSPLPPTPTPLASNSSMRSRAISSARARGSRWRSFWMICIGQTNRACCC